MSRTNWKRCNHSFRQTWDDRTRFATQSRVKASKFCSIENFG